MRLHICLVFVIVTSTQMNSQGRNSWYMYSQVGQKWGSTMTYYPDIKNELKYERIGGGLGLNLGVGRMVHPNFGIELSTTMQLGNAFKTDFDHIKTQTVHSVGSLIIQAPLGKSYIYAKAGIVVGYDYRVTNFPSEGGYYNTKTSLMRGFNGSLGMIVPVSNRFSLMFEAEEISIQGQLKEGFLQAGDPSTANWVHWVEDLNKTSPDPAITTRKAFPIAFSCIGVNFGVHYSFSSRK